MRGQFVLRRRVRLSETRVSGETEEGDADGEREVGVGAGRDGYVEGCEDGDCRGGSHAGGGGLLGELYAAVEVLVVCAECESVSGADGGCEGDVGAVDADGGV